MPFPRQKGNPSVIDDAQLARCLGVVSGAADDARAPRCLEIVELGLKPDDQFFVLLERFLALVEIGSCCREITLKLGDRIERFCVLISDLLAKPVKRAVETDILSPSQERPV